MIEMNEPSTKFKDASIAPMHTAEHILNGTMNRLYNCGRAFRSHGSNTEKGDNKT